MLVAYLQQLFDCKDIAGRIAVRKNKALASRLSNDFIEG